MTSQLKKIHLSRNRIIAIAVGVAVILAIIGFVVWQAATKNSSTGGTADVAKLSQKEKLEKERSDCERKNDKDICRFITNWKMETGYRLTTAIAGRGTYTYTVDGTNTSTKVEGETPYEVITMGDVVYTKAGTTWYKQTIKGASNKVSQGINSNVSRLNSATSESQADLLAKYKLIGKEACGDKTCFVYESERSEGKETVWFDDTDYKARKIVAKIAADTTEAAFEYTNVSVVAPSPVKELAANEYLEPGADAPKRLPNR